MVTADPLTRAILCAAIERQKALIKEMDFPPNPDFHQPGLSWRAFAKRNWISWRNCWSSTRHESSRTDRNCSSPVGRMRRGARAPRGGARFLHTAFTRVRHHWKRGCGRCGLRWAGSGASRSAARRSSRLERRRHRPELLHIWRHGLHSLGRGKCLRSGI